MANHTSTPEGRPAPGRFVRNLALSLSGGALLTVAGAAVAGADEASTDSAGAGAVGSGDATAVGNQSGTTTNQGVAPSGGASNPTVVTQTAVVPNLGVAVANTGGNVAVGNSSDNSSTATQTATGGALLSSNTGSVANVSDGTATIYTGNATAYGNQSTTTIDQSAQGALGILTNQNALALNAGVGLANTGLNTATGNTSTNTAGFVQEATNPNGLATNSASVRSASDGSATVNTGSATATGNKSETWLDQTGGGSGDGDSGGLLIIDQLSAVANLGAGIANTGGNAAVGNTSTNVLDDNPRQAARIHPDTESLLSIASNQADIENTSDGSASVHTGAASATGNASNTEVSQTATGDASPLGGALLFQGSAVLNAGVGAANTGLNLSIGNASDNLGDFNQLAAIGPAPNADIDAPIVAASNSASSRNASDGSAHVRTGDASATGNSTAASTHITQDASADVDGMGLVVGVQAAGVANIGLGVANTGANVAVGNASANQTLEGQLGLIGAQTARIDGDVDATGPVTASNSLDASNVSDGTAMVTTGDANAVGNHSDTLLTQRASGTITAGSGGVVPNVQTAGVLNAGAAVANSGVNAAVGNASGRLGDPNVAAFGQLSSIDVGIPPTLDVVGPVTAANSASLSNGSDGTAKVDTGTANATGNSSYTILSQDLDATVDGMGVVVAPQSAAVANIGVGVANSGVNAAIGNVSGNHAESRQIAEFEPAVDTTVVGPLTVGASTDVANGSDGEACVCTGDATASGNVSRSTLTQDLDVTAEDGVQVVPTSGLILNAGFGLANSGVNLAIGNVSTNEAILIQDAQLDPAAPAVLVGPQAIVNGGGASNSSDGAAVAGAGKATATGNLSESGLVQAATVAGSGVVAPISSTISSAGLGLANSGVNLGVGNASTNSSSLTQTASGTGTVSNQGTASNDSDGTAQINGCDDKVTPVDEPGEPGVATLPRTGGPIETVAAVALMLLLAGFAAQGTSRRRIAAA